MTIKTVYDCVMRCDVDARRDLFKNIVLCGGTAKTKGEIYVMNFSQSKDLRGDFSKN